MRSFDVLSALKRHRNEADWVGLKWISEKTTQRAVRNEKPDLNFTHWDQGVRVEVLVNGHFGYVGTSDISELGIERAFRRAVHQTRELSQSKLFHFTPEQRPKTQGTYRSQTQKSLDNLSSGEVVSVLRDCTQTMKTSDLIENRSARAMIVETQIHSVSSDGGEQFQDFSMVIVDLQATARKGGETQSRSWSSQGQVGGEIFLRQRLLPASESIAREVLLLVDAENCLTGKTKLMLAPDQMTLQIHESIGHPLELDRILGDERNYAGWSFVQLEDFGQLQYGSPLMNVSFDPHRFGELASYNFDDSGERAQKEWLIQNGILLRSLGSVESRARSKETLGVSNFRSSSWNRPPIDRMANINLEPGTTSLKDMIQSIDQGVLMHTNRSWSIDDYRNKFQFGCEFAQWIEEGRVTRVLKNPNYRGKTLDFWRNLIGVSDEMQTFGSPFCGKGEPSQLIRVGHSSPFCLFDQVEIFGGHT